MDQAKVELLRKIGNINQLFGIHPLQYSSGKEDLVKAFVVDTGSGLEFTVMENKCLDIYQLKYQGINCSFMSKAGLSSPYLADQRGLAYRYTQGCGMLYTAGLANVGNSCEDESGEQYFHGTIKNLPAQNVSSSCTWDNGRYIMKIAGDIRESAFWGRNLLLHREITAFGNEQKFYIHDTIENQNYTADELMLLYHFNVGYPLLDAGCEFYAPIVKTEPLSEYSAIKEACFGRMEAPVDNGDEAVYAHTIRKNADGSSAAALWNPQKSLGIYIRFAGEILHYLNEWKTCRSGDYAFGMLPASYKPIGRKLAKAEGGLFQLNPFEKTEVELEIGILSGIDALKQFKLRWNI